MIASRAGVKPTIAIPTFYTLRCWRLSASVSATLGISGVSWDSADRQCVYDDCNVDITFMCACASIYRLRFFSDQSCCSVVWLLTAPYWKQKPTTAAHWTSDLSKAHVTCDNIGPATRAISVKCNKIIIRLGEIPKFEAFVRKTPST